MRRCFTFKLVAASLLAVISPFAAAASVSDPPLRQNPSREAGAGKQNLSGEAGNKQPAGAQGFGKLTTPGFTPNMGQLAPQVKFAARGRGYHLFLTQSEAVFRLPGPLSPSRPRKNGRPALQAGAETVRVQFAGASPRTQVEGDGSLPAHSSYFLGKDPKRWITDVPSFSEVVYREIYPGINLKFYNNSKGALEYDFTIAPGADPHRISLKISAARPLALTSRGDLLIATRRGSLLQRKPVAYQIVDGIRRQVTAGYTIEAGRVNFRLGRFDRSRPLVIDPVLEYSIYLGGDFGAGGQDQAFDLAVDSAGNTYVVGQASSETFPTRGAVQPARLGNSDGFVTKLDRAGQVVYSSYIGGPGDDDSAYGVAVDSRGRILVTGHVEMGAPTTPGAYQTDCRPGGDTFVANVDPALAGPAALVYATCLMGTSTDPLDATSTQGYGIAADDQGRAYLVGEICGTGNRCRNAPEPPSARSHVTQKRGGVRDAFVARLDPEGQSLDYFSRLGGAGEEVMDGPWKIDVGPGNAPLAYVTGSTRSPDFPTTSGAAFGAPRGNDDAVVSVFNMNLDGAASLVYSSYLGGAGRDAGRDISVGSQDFYVTGETESQNLPVTEGAFQPVGPGGNDGFVARFVLEGQLAYLSYLGGAEADSGISVAADRTNTPRDDKIVYVSGGTASDDFPVRNYPDIQSTDGSAPNVRGSTDAFVAKLATALPPDRALLFATYFGSPSNPAGTNKEAAVSIGADFEGSLHTTGTARGDDFPKKNSERQSHNGSEDAYVMKLTPALASVEVSPKSGPIAGGTPVSITGQNLKGAYRVHFGDREVDFVQDSSRPGDPIQVVSPAHPAGPVHVRVTTFEGTSKETSLDVFTYEEARGSPPPPDGPVIAAIIPPSGDIAGGTQVSIAGTGFTGATLVTFGGTQIPSGAFRSAGDTEVVLNSPPHSRAEAVTVTITTPRGISNAAQFIYTQAAVIPLSPDEQPKLREPSSRTLGATIYGDPKAILAAPPGGTGIATPSLAPLPVPGQVNFSGEFGTAAQAGSQDQLVLDAGTSHPAGALSVAPADQVKPAQRHAMAGLNGDPGGLIVFSGFAVACFAAVTAVSCLGPRRSIRAKPAIACLPQRGG